jgi:hypothetical protein
METQGDVGERETDGDRHPLQVPHILLVLGPVIVCVFQDGMDLPKSADIVTIKTEDDKSFTVSARMVEGKQETTGVVTSVINGVTYLKELHTKNARFVIQNRTEGSK